MNGVVAAGGGGRRAARAARASPFSTVEVVFQSASVKATPFSGGAEARLLLTAATDEVSTTRRSAPPAA